MISTRFTERFELDHAIACAPMALASGGRLAAAVAHAGGFGFIGGGYGDEEWLMREFEAAGNHAVGCGFITWSLDKQPQLLDAALAREPRAIMLSFGDPDIAGVLVGEAAGLIADIPPAAELLARISSEAETLLASKAPGLVI